MTTILHIAAIFSVLLHVLRLPGEHLQGAGVLTVPLGQSAADVFLQM